MSEIYYELIPGEKFSAKGADSAPTPDKFPDASRGIPDDVVEIDMEPGLKITQAYLDKFKPKTEYVHTPRGLHVRFRKPPGYKTFNGVCALGFEIEHLTSKNRPTGTVIKQDGVLREVVNQGMLEELPWYFGYSKKQFQNMVGLGEGNGRNNALFSHKQKLNSHPDTEKVCRFINEVLFDTPLNEKEFNTVIREYTGSGAGTSEYSQAEILKNEYRCVFYQGSIWWWDGHEYTTDIEKKDDRLRKMIYLRNPDCKSYFVDEICKQIADRADTITRSDFPIVLRNGIIEDGEFTEIEDFREFSPFRIDATYDPNAPDCPEVTDYLEQITGGDEDYKKLIAEILAYPLIVDPDRIASIAKFIVFRGDGANGKSTLLKILRKIYQPRNCASLSIKQVADKAYHVSLLGKLVNLGDDVEPDAITNAEMKIIKNVCSADIIETRRLYQQGMSVRITAKLFFTSNSDIHTFEKGYAYQRRVMWLPMFNKIETPDPLFVKKLTSPAALAHWLRLMVEGYKRLYENCTFSPCEKVTEYNEQYHLDNDIMARFLSDINIETAILGKTATEVKTAFDIWNDDPQRSFSKKRLNELLREKGIGVGRKKLGNNTVIRCYLKQSDTTQKLSKPQGEQK